MSWGSAANFWAMGGYGFYVWGSYAAVVAVIAVELWMLRARRRSAVIEVKAANLKQEATQSAIVR